MRHGQWLAGAAAIALGATGVDAQTTDAVAPDAVGTTAASAAPPAGNQDPGEIVVLGFGQSRQVQTVTDVDIARLTPGTSPLKAISKLPSVNFQAADPFGAYEWAVRISIRGFNQNQLGFTLDGIPLGDMSYGNVNGLHISRAQISENIASATVAQGAGAVGTASTSNLGGTVEFTSRAPADEAGFAASGTYGSNNNARGYVRLESGDLGGVKGYLSYAYLNAEKWKGVGPQRQHQVSARVQADIGSRGSITVFTNFSDRRETDYQDLSLDIIRRLGYRDDNIGNNYPLALNIARVYANQVEVFNALQQRRSPVFPFPASGVVFPAPYNSQDDAYFDAGGLRRDYLTGGIFDARLSDAVTFSTTVYYHNNKGQGSWITPYVATPAGAPDQNGAAITNPAPLSFRTTEYSISRGGAISRLRFESDPNTLEVGGWYESNSFKQARRFYGMALGDAPNRGTLQFQTNPFSTQWFGRYDTETLQYYVADTLKLGELTLNGGWKGFRVINRARLQVGTLAQGRISAEDWFLPQAGAVLGVGGGAELFASYTENLRAFVSSATTGPFATTQEGFNAIVGTLKPERSRTVEGGVRLRSNALQVSAAGYYVDFKNRLLGFQNGAGIVGNPVTLNNVGRVRSYGAEFTANYRFTPAFSLFGSYSYNNSKYRDDVVNAQGVTLAFTRGKTTVDSPRHLAKGELVYDDSQFFVRGGVDYMSRRYFTYENDQSVPGRVLVDASIGYRFKGDGFLNNFSIEGSVTNLTKKQYISTIGSNGFTARGDNQTLLAGAPRQFFVTLRKGL